MASILGFIAIILPTFISYLTAFILSTALYLLYIIFASLIHIRFSLTRIAILLYFGESFFTVVCRNFMLIEDFKLINLCQKFTVLTLVSNIIQFVILLLLFIDLVNPNTFYYKQNVNNEKSENELLENNEISENEI